MNDWSRARGPDGSYQAVLTNPGGLQNASSVLAQAGKVYVLSAAYVTQKDRNILVADLDWSS